MEGLLKCVSVEDAHLFGEEVQRVQEKMNLRGGAAATVGMPVDRWGFSYRRDAFARILLFK